MDTLFDKLKRVRAFVFDVDGVLSPSSILVTEDGHQLRSFSTKDGYAVQVAVRMGYPVAIITGSDSPSVTHRMAYLGVTDVFMAVREKDPVLDTWLASSGVKLDEIMYMGDDIPDRPIMQRVGMPVCPADAVEEIKAVSKYISPFEGGAGAVRDVIEKVLKLHGKWALDATIGSR